MAAADLKFFMNNWIDSSSSSGNSGALGLSGTNQPGSAEFPSASQREHSANHRKVRRKLRSAQVLHRGNTIVQSSKRLKRPFVSKSGFRDEPRERVPISGHLARRSRGRAILPLTDGQTTL